MPESSSFPTRRKFLGSSLAVATVSILPPSLFAARKPEGFRTPLEQGPLPFAFNALEPAIDAQTMEIHFGKHHAGYVRKLNTALESWPEGLEYTTEGLVANLDKAPEGIRTALRNNGGGHLNHSIFWSILSAPGAMSFQRRTPLGRTIREKWGNLDAFWSDFARAGSSVFGSGWVWLVTATDGSLEIVTTTNQDNPLMSGAPGNGAFPVIGVDVWEHAYYLRYQNARSAYLEALKECINWEEANRRYVARAFWPER